MIEQEDPDTVAAVFMEPVQNSGGTFTPPEGYFQGVRELCDEYGILLVADEVICGFGRLGHWFGSERYDIRPDIVTFAKGIGSAHVPLGGVLMTDRVAAPFIEGTTIFNHGITYGGHPVATAVALKNLEVMERESVLENVRENEPYFRGVLEDLGDKPIVGDVRGAGYFMSIELVKDKDTKQTFDEEEAEHLLRGFLSRRLYESGLICRADDRGDPVIQLSPPLVATRDDLDYIHDVLDTVLDEAWEEMHRHQQRPEPFEADQSRPCAASPALVLTVADILAIRELELTPGRRCRRRPSPGALGAHLRARRPHAVAARRRAAADHRPAAARRPRRLRRAAGERGLAGLGLGLGFGFDELPAAAARAADRLGFPVFTIPYHVPFIAITEAVFTGLSNQRVAETERRLAGDLVEAALSGELAARELRRRTRAFGLRGGWLTFVVLRPDRAGSAALTRLPEAAGGRPGGRPRRRRGGADRSCRRRRRGGAGGRPAGRDGCVRRRRGPRSQRRRRAAAGVSRGAVCAGSASGERRPGRRDLSRPRVHAAVARTPGRAGGRALLRRGAGPAGRPDARTGSALVESLRAYIEANGRWAEAAASLRVHRHTLRYRMRKVEELTGRNLADAADRLELWLALRAHEFARSGLDAGRGGRRGRHHRPRHRRHTRRAGGVEEIRCLDLDEQRARAVAEEHGGERATSGSWTSATPSRPKPHWRVPDCS